MNRLISHMAVVATALALVVATPGEAAPRANPAAPPHFANAQADCYAIGQQVAIERGGTLARATPATRNGEAVCEIVVLLPARDGQHPRRAEYTVPAK
ncbi:MAG: hypothetical protein K5872_04505 [Rhizobiaceae bacterium]|nr:hypothetical protein [Rhizobiaceae bacterium]MCV0405472.1 hypothetical protein [Rhizobiaceae bacterium]